MRRFITLFLAFLLSTLTYGQPFIPGDYNEGLKLSYDSATNKVTGYFENYSGLDEKTNNPKFSCIFYIEGIAAGLKFQINTYYPTDKNSELIQGKMEIVTAKKVRIALPEEHGGCWNVQHFADQPAEFKLERKQKWIQVRYVDTTKAYFYDAKSNSNRLKAYLVKGDFVCVQIIENDWAYCTYFGKKITKGWLMIRDLNKL